MTETAAKSRSRATAIAVCSGKGGVGKSTLALLLASRLAESGRRTLLVDADFGLGDLGTLTNLTPLVGFEQLLAGVAQLEEAALPIGPKLSFVGTLPGSTFAIADVTPDGLAACQRIDDEFDVVLFDTPSTLDAFNLSLIGSCDLMLAVTTARIPSIADTYVQLKRIAAAGSRATGYFVVSRPDNEFEADQTIAKFGELLDRFLGRRLQALGVVEGIPAVEQAAESQNLLELTRQPGGFGKRAERMLRNLLEKRLVNAPAGCSIWEQLGKSISLRSEFSFDDNKVLVGVPG
jgi:flagellar biosynthesis protein FlhG